MVNIEVRTMRSLTTATPFACIPITFETLNLCEFKLPTKGKLPMIDALGVVRNIGLVIKLYAYFIFLF